MTQKQHGEGQGETVLRKYPNRRIYDATRNTHVTLGEIADRIKAGERIRILDHKTGEDLTQVTMGQVLVETLKSRPDYLPLDLVTLMIRAQDNVVRDFLYNGLPQAFQGYLDQQRRLMSGMMMNPWLPGSFPSISPFGSFFGAPPQPQPQTAQPQTPPQQPYPGPAAAQPAQPSAPPYAAPSQPPAPQPQVTPQDNSLREELQRLRREVEALKHAEKPVKGRRRKS